jgi:geranylgeranyl pyrophosphate synthase
MARDGSFPQVFNDALATLISARGKLIRPVLTLCASEISGRRYNSLALEAATALEMVHVSSLILDDIIDGSSRRRGVPSLHKQYGNDVAIVSAGLLLLRGLRSVGEVKRMRLIGYEAIMNLLLGQAIEARGDVNTQAQYLRMIRLKTGALFEAATRMGAAANRLAPGVTERLAAYGRNLGIAFQIRDDILDFNGSPQRLGKPVRSDIRASKPTIVLIEVCNVSGLPRERLRSNDSYVRRLAKSNGILAHAGLLAERYAQKAADAIGNLVDTPARQCLLGLARHVTSRDH